MSTPQFVGTSLSAICQMLPRPQTMTGMFVEHFQRHFAETNFREDGTLRELLWRDTETTNILIESVWRWDPRNTNLRPAIIVKRNRYTFQRIGIGDNRHQLQPTDGQGNPHYFALWIGSHTLFAMGGSGAQAELLGAEVQREMTQFGPALRKSLGLMRLEVVDVGPVHLLEEAQDNFVVPITVSYCYPEAWMLRPQAPTAKVISLSTLLDF